MRLRDRKDHASHFACVAYAYNAFACNKAKRELLTGFGGFGLVPFNFRSCNGSKNNIYFVTYLREVGTCYTHIQQHSIVTFYYITNCIENCKAIKYKRITPSFSSCLGGIQCTVLCSVRLLEAYAENYMVYQCILYNIYSFA